jgi:hypothetical protein
MMDWFWWNPTAEDRENPYYFVLVALTWLSGAFLAWMFTPWFPWK